ncbi:uncharacterized protein LOC111713331 [Eurytemora carolleeae]|uniref:uncharacterized protein LOC111713331 n=1 Tax=Eurytemora carolleeae TaxID=1294199 RepID=UPI000C760F4F|nr:uncharacterized protein LOC111713331 [Eurytemora carolleeae]XP_023343941.1 uncharacterized protein LOC111713331 [Eurytemora carolleeae]XP_023343942.1 uncharacterized protein LOC111713331 [Eurytemora carolleeae]|eukprot:XP_023343940.1 uncharacterized protein LOC111713331 [Eurytemora affinis]
MFVDKFLLPRFLVLELVLASHFFQFTKACLLNRGSGPGDGTESCLIPLDSSDWKHKPLFYTQNRDWIYPDAGRILRVVSGETILLSCPGSSLIYSSSPSLLVLCKGTELQVKNTKVRESQLGCVKPPRNEERRTGEPCGPLQVGEIVELGYKEDFSFKPVLSFCHEVDSEQTYYTQHTLRGSTLQFNSIDQTRPAFKEGKLFYKKISASATYSQRNQEKVLTSILGQDRSRELLNSSFLARGHLAPDADFLYQDWQDATYYYGNIAPQWQSINNGNWRRLENSIRTKGKKLYRDLEIFSGTLGILQVNGETGLQEIWLGTDGSKKYIPVPEYFFKIIVDSVESKSIGIFCTNNPFLERVLRSTVLCTDICDETGWGDKFKNRFEVGDGLIFCCSPAEMYSLVPWVGASSLRLQNYTVLHF